MNTDPIQAKNSTATTNFKCPSPIRHREPDAHAPAKIIPKPKINPPSKAPNQKLAGIRFFYREVLGRQDFTLRVPAKRSGRLPEPLSRSEIQRLLDVTQNVKHRMLLMTTYGGGLRVSELVHLQPRDIHSQRMLIRVNQGKGRKGRYTHRVAISNHRLLHCEHGEVAFRYRDRSDGDRVKQEVLPADEFLARFLQHVLPDKFFRIRHYGLLANCVKQEQLARCRQLLGCRAPSAADSQPHTAAEWMRQLLGIDVTRCPVCGQPLHQAPLPCFGPPCDLTSAPPAPSESEPWDTA